MSDLTSKQKLLLDLTLHHDDMFYQRANFFLVAESMILVAYSLLASRQGAVLTQGRVIAAFGLILTIIWAYAAHRALVRLKYLTRRAEAGYPYFAALRAERPKPVGSIGSTLLMAYMIPAIAIVMWAILLFT